MPEPTLSITEEFGGQPFLVGPSALKKLIAVISTRKPGKLKISLGFSDGSTIESVDIDEVSAQPNQPSRRLTRATFLFVTAAQDRIHLVFTSTRVDPISLSIQSKDSDWVALVAAELRDLIRGEIIVEGYGRALLIFRCTAVLFLVASCVLCVWFGDHYSTTSQELPSLIEVLKSPDPNKKLDYIIRREFDKPQTPLYLALSLLLGITLSIFLLLGWSTGTPSLFSFLYPVNEFLIGAGSERVRRRKTLRSNLFWVVVIGFAVSLIGGFILLVLQR